MKNEIAANLEIKRGCELIPPSDGYPVHLIASVFWAAFREHPRYGRGGAGECAEPLFSNSQLHHS